MRVTTGRPVLLHHVKAREWGYPHDNEEWVQRHQRCVELIEAVGR